MVGRRLVESQKNSLRISAVCQVRRTVGVSTSNKLQKLSSTYVHGAIFKDLPLPHALL